MTPPQWPPLCRTCGRIHALLTRPDRTIDWVTVAVEHYPLFLALRRELGHVLAAWDAGEMDAEEG